MRVLEAIAAPITLTANGIATSQTPGGAGNLTLDGAAATTGPSAPTAGATGLTVTTVPIVRLTPPRPVSITSGSDISNRTFVVTGYDRGGVLITETITGPNNATVSGLKVFARIDSIAISGSAAGAITVGWTALSYSRWIFVGNDRKNFSHMIRVFRSGTATYDLQATSMPMNQRFLHGQGRADAAADYLGGEQPDDIITISAAATGDTDLPMLVPYVAVRLKVNAQNANVTLRINKSITG